MGSHELLGEVCIAGQHGLADRLVIAVDAGSAPENSFLGEIDGVRFLLGHDVHVLSEAHLSRVARTTE